MSETTEMMIVEALKKLRIIEKKMNENTRDIQQYASQVSTERPYFETEEKQRNTIKQLIQANTDLMKNYLDLKNRIDYTNLMVEVEMDGDKFTIAQLLIIQRKLAAMMFATYNALNDNEGNSRLRSVSHMAQAGEKQPHVIRFYKEEEKREQRRKWQDLMNNITTRLEVINATTPLLDLPSTS